MNLEKIKQQKTVQELLEFGIINLNKPSGPTSFDVSNFVNKKLGLRKTSHFGTLDPKVTGVLPVALNRACKLTGYFLGEDKEYVGIMRIHEDISLEKLKEAISKKFLGKISQTPPVRSRVKRQERQREIKKFEIIEKDGKDILFHVECEGGTYIRKLIDDLGKELGIGAHMMELRRVRAGIFKENDKEYPSVTLYDFEKAVEEYKKGNEKPLKEIIIPAEIISEVYEFVNIKDANLKKILTGKPVHNEDLLEKQKLEGKNKIFSSFVQAWPRKGEIVCIFCKESFIGMYKVLNEGDVFAKSEFVFN